MHRHAVVLTAVALACAAHVGAQCTPPSDDPRWDRDGSLGVYGEVVAAGDGNHFVVGGGNSVRVATISGGAPTVVNEIVTAGTQPFLATDLPLLFAADQQHGVTVFDLSTPSAPSCSEHIALPCSPSRLTVTPDLIVAACSDQLGVIERVGRGHRLRSTVDILDSFGAAVAVRPGPGAFAWLGTLDAGIVGYDLTDPGAPVAQTPINDGTNDLLTVFDLVWVEDRLVATGLLPDADGTPAVVVYNVSDPGSPIRQGSTDLAIPLLDVPLYGLDLFVPGLGLQGYLATIGGLGGLTVPSSGAPQFNAPGINPFNLEVFPAWTVAVTPGRIVTTGPTGMDAYTGSPSGLFNPYGRTGGIRTSGLLPQQVTVHGGVALAWLISLEEEFVADHSELVPLDASSTDGSLTEIAGGRLELSVFGTNELATHGDWAYLRSEDSLVVIDLSAPELPSSSSTATSTLTSLAQPATVRDDLLATAGTFDDAGSDTPVVELWSRADPSQPVLLTTLEPTASVLAMEILANETLALVLDDGAVQLVDVHTPTSPASLDLLPLPAGTDATDVASSGRDLLLLSDEQVAIWSLADPSTPSLSTATAVADAGLGRMTVHGNLVAIPVGAHGVAILEMGAGPTVTEIHRFDTNSVPTQVAVAPDRLIVCDGDGIVSHRPRPAVGWAGDTNGDGAVAPTDLPPLAAELLDADGSWVDEVAGAGPTTRAADADQNGRLDAGDLSALIELATFS